VEYNRAGPSGARGELPQCVTQLCIANRDEDDVRLA
jgi:hypothetical protein